MPLTRNTPKCLLEVGGRPLLFNTLSILKEFNLKEISIVTGFCADQIESYCRTNFSDLDVSFFENKIYNETNNAYSLMLALQNNTRPFLLLDGDLLFPPKLLKDFLAQGPNKMAVDSRPERLTEEAMKAQLDANGNIQKLTKTCPLNQASGEYIGMMHLDDTWAQKLNQFLKQQDTQFMATSYYEDALNALIPSSPKLTPATTRENWTEIDTPEDLANANLLLK